MAFTTKEFPGRVFKTLAEYEEAKTLRQSTEAILERRAAEPAPTVKVTAVIEPAPADALERRINSLEQMLSRLLQSKPGTSPNNPDGVPVGTPLYGETLKGGAGAKRRYEIEAMRTGYILKQDYLIGPGENLRAGTYYPTLSAAALAVSGNRRSGWAFWRMTDGRTIGEAAGKHKHGDDVSGLRVNEM